MLNRPNFCLLNRKPDREPPRRFASTKHFLRARRLLAHRSFGRRLRWIDAVLAAVAAEADRLLAIFHLAIGSGMREGEMFGLQWPSLDLAAGSVSVVRSLSEISGMLSQGEPKSAKSRRRIILPGALEEHRKRQMAAGFGGVESVFCNLSGGPMRRSHFQAAEFKPLLRRAGLPPVRFHDLRHTHDTPLMLLAGENPKVVQER